MRDLSMPKRLGAPRAEGAHDLLPRRPARIVRFRRTFFFEVGLALITAGVVVLLFVAYELVGTNLSEEHSQASLARQFNAVVSGATSGTVPAPGEGGRGGAPAKGAPAAKHRSEPVVDGVPLPLPPPGGALDHLVIPAIGVDRYVVQGVAEDDLQEGPGHYPGTPLPGQAGNVGIAGHRTTFGAPFFELNLVVPGDLIYLTDTSGTTWVYSVVHQWVVAPTDVTVLDATHQAVLTLTTCNPRFEATSRLVVRAALAERLAKGTRFAGDLPVSLKAARQRATVPVAGGKSPTTTAPGAAVPTTGPAATSTSAPGAGGTGSVAPGGDSPTVGPAPKSAALVSAGGLTWVALAGWAALALVAWVATRVLAARRTRSAKWMVLLAGAMVCLVPLWFTFENAVSLLPANL